MVYEVWEVDYYDNDNIVHNSAYSRLYKLFTIQNPSMLWPRMHQKQQKNQINLPRRLRRNTSRMGIQPGLQTSLNRRLHTRHFHVLDSYANLVHGYDTKLRLLLLGRQNALIKILSNTSELRQHLH